MSLENGKSLVGFAYGSANDASSNAGIITFARDTRQIFVGDGSTAVAFAGNVKDASFVDKVLKIWLNDNVTPISLDFSDVASAEGTASLLGGLRKDLNALNDSYTQYVTDTDTAITNITKADTGAIAVAVKAEADLRAKADTSILNKIGTVADGKTVVDMITDAKAEAVSAHSKVAVEENDFITVDTSQDASGATTYTIKTTDIQSADAYNTKMQTIDSSFTKVEGDIAALTSGENSVDKKIENAINGLESSESGTDDSSFVTVTVSQTAGEIASVNVSTGNIASATDLGDVSTRVKANEDAITTLNGDGAGSVKKQVSDAIAGVVNSAPEAFDTLGEIATWITNDQTGAAAMSAQIAAHTTAIADNSTAIANLDVSYKAADTAIRNEFAAADTTTLNAAKDYAKTAVEQTHTHSNKELLDTYTQTEENLADAVAKKHSHENKAVLDGISSAKVSAWDSAEQNAKDYADSLAGNYATAAQGTLADSALQKADITSGSANGTISVEGTDVAVKGLGSAAYTESSAYDVSGAAAGALADAKDYADALTGATIKTGSTVAELQDKTIASVLESFKAEIADASEAGVQSIAVNTNSSAYAEVDDSTGAVTFTIKTGVVQDATAENNALATTHDVKTYVDNAISAAALKWTVFE